MDQVKAILQILKKHHFWLLCVICLIAGVLGWTMAARRLSAAYAKRKTEIEGKFKDLDTIEKTQNFPNARWAEEVEKLTKEEKTKVRRTWKGVYDEQAKLLKWPEWTAPPPAEMPLSYREQYATKIGSEFANLLAIIGAESHETSQNAAVVSSADKKKHDAGHEDRVVWDASSQESVHKKLQLVAPSALEVLLTQEDLWAYQVLLTIIKNVNADKYVPPVKEIVTLVVAQKAAESFEKGLESGIVEMPKAGRAAALGGERAPLAAAAQPGAAPPAPDEGRYLDSEGKRMASGTAAKEQFKRLPVFIKLVVDQREIPKLLVECANSTLPVEIQQLRVNPTKGASSATDRRPGSAGPSTERAASYDIPIEICGIISIYNPPDVSKLGAETEGEAAPAAPAAAAAGAAQPAVAPGG